MCRRFQISDNVRSRGLVGTYSLVVRYVALWDTAGCMCMVVPLQRGVAEESNFSEFRLVRKAIRPVSIANDTDF
jgi:hypothetical protein